MGESDAKVVSIEQHYRFRDLKEKFHLSDRSLRRLFADEPGVVVLPHEICRKKRKYETVLIPESVVLRVLNRCSRAA